MTEEEARWVEINIEMFTFNFANAAKMHYNKLFVVIDALAGAGDYSVEAVKYALNEIAYNRGWIRPTKLEAVVLLKNHGVSVRDICNLVKIGTSTYYDLLEEYNKNGLIIKARLSKDVLRECKKFLHLIKKMGGMYYDIDTDSERTDVADV